MASLQQISTKLIIAESKRHNFIKALKEVRSHDPVSFQREDLEQVSHSVNSSMESCFQGLKTIDNEINDLFEKVGFREKELKLQRDELKLGYLAIKDGKELIIQQKRKNNKGLLLISGVDQISSSLIFMEENTLNFVKSLQKVRAQPLLSTQRKELEEVYALIKCSMETLFKELEFKEKEISDRLKVLKNSEKEFTQQVKELRWRFIINKNGKSLLLFLKEHENDGAKIEEVYNELRNSKDPASLVVEAVKVYISRVGDCGILGIEERVLTRTCVFLLEQLMRLKPKIGQKTKENAERVAKRWKENMKARCEDDIEVMGFLMILATFGLVHVFDLNEIQSLYERVSQHERAFELGRVLGLDGTTPGINLLHASYKLKKLGLKNYVSKNKLELESLHFGNLLPSQVASKQDMVSSPVSRWPQLESFCISMNGRGLIEFLCQSVNNHDSMRCAISDALKLASDPAKLVLDVVPGFHRSNKHFDGLAFEDVRICCLLLLEQLMSITPNIDSYLNEDALKWAVDWKNRVSQKNPVGIVNYGLLLFIVDYKLVSAFDAYDLLSILVGAARHKPSPKLCLALGLADKIFILIHNLLKNKLMLEAVVYICTFDLCHVFPPDQILKDYFNDLKRRKNKGKKTNLRQNKAIDREIETLRVVINCIVSRKLESCCPPGRLLLQIEELKKQKTETTSGPNKEKMKTHENQTSGSILFSDVKLQQFRLDTSKLDDLFPS